MSSGTVDHFSVIGFILPLILWLASLVLGIYIIVLVIKLARRGITALDLYIFAKNREIRERYESTGREEL
ncbi:hypothetical protein [Paenibacillus tepidiphilus]|uniref:hypothetical protein n=1 Tax=Paenibacillus tepidiphilus TaxID=2608683 RepID=UPI0012397534|nr:hypothetical protein [Paenibacillus tepidiphilus]